MKCTLAYSVNSLQWTKSSEYWLFYKCGLQNITFLRLQGSKYSNFNKKQLTNIHTTLIMKDRLKLHLRSTVSFYNKNTLFINEEGNISTLFKGNTDYLVSFILIVDNIQFSFSLFVYLYNKTRHLYVYTLPVAGRQMAGPNWLIFFVDTIMSGRRLKN